jgi:transcriptional regulator with XRE-family HTH domain
MEKINQKLRNLRKERGLTLADLAEKMGTDHQHLSRIERGKSKLTVDFLLKLANALETPVEGIMDQSVSKEPIEEEKVVSSNPPVPLPQSSSFLLATILEKIETLSSKHHISLSCRKKAFLASEIYTQTAKALVHRDPEQMQRAFIDCSLAMLELILEKNRSDSTESF